MKFFLSLICLIASACTKWPGPYLDKTISGPMTKICILGDVGKKSPAQGVVARALKEEKCHDIYFLGDIIYPSGLKNSKDPALKTRFLKYYEQLTTTDNKPRLHIILGNHDYESNPDAWIEISKQNPSIHYPSPFYFERYEDFCFVALDTNLLLVDSRRNIQKEQEKWLQRIKPALKSCKHSVALTHHPLYTPGPNHENAHGPLKNFLETQILGSFDYLFSGHEHIVAGLGVKKGTKMFISGAGGALAKGHLPGYITLEKKTPDSLPEVKMKKINYQGQIEISQ